MLNFLKQNKNTGIVKIVGLVIIITSFLVWPFSNMGAQEALDNTNSVDNTNTNTAINTNSEQGTDVLNTEEAEELDALNQLINDKREEIDELKKKSEIYEENLKIKQQETITLQNQLSIIDIEVSQTENNIDTVGREIEAVNYELIELQIVVEENELELARQREVLAELVRILYKYDQRTYLEVILSNESFSDFYNQMQYSEDLEGKFEDNVEVLKGVKSNLEADKQAKEDKKDELDKLIETLEVNVSTLSDQKVYKEDLLIDTKESEDKFGDLLEVAKQEQLAAQQEILSLESQARERLEEEGIEWEVDTGILLWPIANHKGISAYFHDPGYPFRKYFEHPAVDIRADQGKSVRAAANGYVVRAKNAGMGYSYVMIVHSDEMSTVYGHLSQIDVAEDTYIVRGQQIGLSGGMPGTPGAGRLTTGPHLHFEVRVNGIPVNPLDYLP